MADRYKTAESDNAQFFESSETTETTETPMSTESNNAAFFDSSTEAADDSPVINANETSDWYIALGNLQRVVTAFGKAHPSLSTNWSGKDNSELHPHIRYLKAIHEQKKRIAIRQKDENECSIKFKGDDGYAAKFADELPTITTEEVGPDDLELLRNQEGSDDWPKGSTDEMGQGYRMLLPTIDGDSFPLTVMSEEQYDTAMAYVNAIPEEPATDTDGTAESSGYPTEFAQVAKAMEVDPSVLDADMEGYPLPHTMTVDEIEETVEGVQDVCLLRTMLEAETTTKNRTTAKPVIKRQLKAAEEAMNNSNSNSNSNSKSNNSGTNSGSNPQQTEESTVTVPSSSNEEIGMATRVEMAMSLQEDGHSVEEAKRLAGL